MENLNDVEFGSDKSTEEAPILVAQRYLNIYRQIHIFNKDKRDQFDDELLALPQNITDFFKKMPGGRLLVEHIEEVKTERGISFVKANKEDFTTGGENNASGGTVATQPVSGGTVSVDASFAQALAQSMANAFKQLPVQQSSGNGGFSPSSANFSKAFDLIAEEIKLSRTSLLDVLQEMHTVTSSLIASQASISRTLESILTQSSKTVDVENSVVAEKSSQLRKETNQKINSLSQEANKINLQHGDVSTHHFSEMKNNPQQEPHLASHPTAVAQSPASQVAAPVNSNEDQVRKKKKKKKNKENRNPEHSDTGLHNQPVERQSSQHVMQQPERKEQSAPSLAIKSEKLVPAFEGIIHSTAAKHLDAEISQPADDALNNTFSQGILPNEAVSTEFNATFDSPISSTENESFMEPASTEINMDDLADLINNNASPNVQQSLSSSQEQDFQSSIYDHTENIPDSDGLDFALPEQNAAATTNETFSLPSSKGVDDVFNNDGLDYALPEQNLMRVDEETSFTSQAPVNNLDDIFNGDGLDFALPEDNSSQQEVTIPSQPNINSDLDSMFGSDGLDFALPEQGSANIQEPQQQTSLDNLDFMFGDNSSVETAPYHEEKQEINQPELQPSFDDLDSIFNNNDDLNSVSDESSSSPFVTDDLDSMFSENTNESSKQVFSQPIESHEQKLSVDSLDDILDNNSLDTTFSSPQADMPHSINLDEDFNSLDTLANNISSETSDKQIEPQNIPTPTPHKEAPQSRYSEELDRIRAALTSDNVDVASLEQPIELDDYDDDEGILKKEDDDIIITRQPTPDLADTLQSVAQQSTETDSEDWDWEYVDENGNPVSASGDEEEWEWEYVEDDEAENEPDNNSK